MVRDILMRLDFANIEDKLGESSISKKKCGNVCPVCERPASVSKIYKKTTHIVKGQSITVRAPIYRCNQCGEEWSNSNDPEDSLGKAYAIYASRKYPQARRFSSASLRDGFATVLLCESCVIKYKMGELSPMCTRTICSSKGCKNIANYRCIVGEI